MSGSAFGSSTRLSTWGPVIPIPNAASRTAGGTFCTPAYELERIGGIASSTSTISVGIR